MPKLASFSLILIINHNDLKKKPVSPKAKTKARQKWSVDSLKTKSWSKMNVQQMKNEDTFGEAHVESDIVRLSDDLDRLSVHHAHDAVYVRDLNETCMHCSYSSGYPLTHPPNQ